MPVKIKKSPRTYTLQEVRDNNGVYEEVDEPRNIVVSHNCYEDGVLLFFDADEDTCEPLAPIIWDKTLFFKSETAVTFSN